MKRDLERRMTRAREYGLERRRRLELNQTPRPLPLPFAPVALEAERVVPVRTDRASIAESGLPVAAGLADLAGTLRLVGSGERHLDPPQQWSQRPLTAQVIRQTFASRQVSRASHCGENPCRL